jgi:hypothetical protein
MNGHVAKQEDLQQTHYSRRKQVDILEWTWHLLLSYTQELRVILLLKTIDLKMVVPLFSFELFLVFDGAWTFKTKWHIRHPWKNPIIRGQTWFSCDPRLGKNCSEINIIKHNACTFLIPKPYSYGIMWNYVWYINVITLALSSRPRQGLTKVQAKSETRESHFMLSGV